MSRTGITAAALLALVAGGASGQVVINEVWENVPGDADLFDQFLEYIEIYGEPGTDLTGFAVALLKGGSDFNADNIQEAPAEIDEAFQLDGIVIPASGIVVLHNNTGGPSDIQFIAPATATLRGFVQAHIPTTDTAGRLGNGGSSTYTLVRRRPLHSVSNNASVYQPGYAFRKDVNPDVNFDSRLDFGNEAGSLVIDPLQVIDDVAWSNNGGKEYVRSSEQEISDTPGFNPDGISRVAYYGVNPQRGLRVDSMGQTVPTRTADEEWVYGEQGPGDGAFTYLTTAADVGAPTDPNGNGFQDISVVGFEMTPGTPNDAGAITQFRFLRGDFNFDQTVDAADGALINASLAEDLDRTMPCNTALGAPSSRPCFVYEGRLANGLMAMMNMVKTDGPVGSNAAFVTQADIDAWNNEFGAPTCPADFNGDTVPGDIFDLFDFLAALDGGLDFNGDTSPADIFDLFDFLAVLDQGCP